MNYNVNPLVVSSIASIAAGFMRLLLLIPLLQLTACSTEQSDNVLRMGLTNAPANLDPRLASDAVSSRINRLLYRRLVDFDESGMPVPSLASWELLNPVHYRFTLGNDGRIFHHDKRLVADDVKATLDSVLDPTNASPHRSTIEIIQRIEVEGTDQIDFFLKHPDSLFPAYLGIGILPADLIAVKHPFTTWPVGSGPMQFDSWPEDSVLRLSRIQDGQLFEFLPVKDPSVRILKLLRGELDIVQNDLPPELLGYLEDKEGIDIVKRQGTNFSYIGFNLEDAATGHLKVRQAIAHAIDRTVIIQHLLKGGAKLAQALLPPEHWAGSNDLYPIKHDPGLARQLLAEAGFGPDNPLRLTYKTSSDPFRVRLATVIQNQLSHIGIEVDLRSYDWGTFYGDIKAGRFQMYSLAWVGVKTPDIFHYIFHSDSIPPHGANRGRLFNPHVDALIEQAETTQDLEEKRQIYRRLQVLLLQALPYVPLWYEDHVFVASHTVEGYHVAPDGNYDGLLHIERQTLNTMNHATLIPSSQSPIE